MSESILVYEVGGSVRDRIIGVEHHDFDYAVEAPSFQAMKNHFESLGYSIYVEKPEFGCILAKHPDHKKSSDFTLCRKDGYYSDNRRPDFVVPGTIIDDLARRDFTINAIAIDPKGHTLDPHNGIDDIEKRLIRCIRDTHTTIMEDPLRFIRAYRFGITKRFRIDESIQKIVHEEQFLKRFRQSVSIERVQNELNKMLLFDPIESIRLLGMLPESFLNIIFKPGLNGLKLTTTMKNKIHTNGGIPKSRFP